VRLAVSLCVLFALAGCASYVGSLNQMNRALASHDTKTALAALAPLEGGRDQALYLLDKAMILRMRRDYAESIGAFERAKPLLHYLEATSVTETAAALTLTENLSSYTPPLYERLLLHVYQSLNYLQSSDGDDARVEIRQIDQLLKRLYPKTDAAPGGADAFARYFAGLVYEDAGAWSDAMIAYRKAYKAYRAAGRPVPPGLETSLCRFADYLGLKSQLSRYKKQFGISDWPPVVARDKAADGELVFLFSDGLAPRKVAVTQAVEDPHNAHFYSISLPTLRPLAPPAQAARVKIAGQSVPTVKVENIARNAAHELDANRASLVGKELSRDVARGVVAHQADKKQPGLGALFSLIGTAFDRADTRTWNTLPDNIQMTRVRLEPGRYDMTVSLVGAPSGRRVFDNVVIKPGRITFVTWHAIGY
jgi:hypothetical protein